MKIVDLTEMTSVASVAPGAVPMPMAVQSIGKLEYRSGNQSIRLYKRNHEGKACCIARIRRTSGDGWRFHKTKKWKELDLPHFGNITDAKLPVNGSKTITSGLTKILTKWGIRYDGLKPLED